MPLHQLGDRVGLPTVPVRVVQAGDLAGVVEERPLVANPGREPELVGDVGLRISVVVDVDLVEDVVAELVEVRSAGGALQRDVVGDQGHCVWLVRTDERVDVGVIGDQVLRDLRCLAVGGHADCSLVSWNQRAVARASRRARVRSVWMISSVPTYSAISPVRRSRTRATTGWENSLDVSSSSISSTGAAAATPGTAVAAVT